MNQLLSHVKKDAKKRIIWTKTIEKHVAGLLKNVLIAKDGVNYFGSDFDDLLVFIIRLHDLGKYTHYFQHYLKTDEKHPQNFQNHALIGAITAWNALSKTDEVKAFVAYFVIKYHHANLEDIRYSFYNRSDSRYRDRRIQIEAQSVDLLPKLSTINQEQSVSLIDLEIGNTLPDLEDFVDEWLHGASIKNFFWVNYTFSLLIESDKLDASETSTYIRQNIDDKLVKKHISRKKTSPLRNQVRKTVLNRLADTEVLTKRIYTLTAPTGVGKTFTALDFALKLRNTVSELKTAQIIYALPFINIIEQGFDEYKKVLGTNCRVFAHYQYADAFGLDKKANLTDEETGYNQRLMELDTWQADIVITSFVQLFHTLIGYRNKLLKKFHHLANAILILDEVQTLRLEQLPLIGSMLYYLSKFLDTRIILMTATKPKLLDLAYREILNKENEPSPENWSIELLTNYEHIYRQYKRTQIIPILAYQFQSDNIEQEFVEKVFANYWSEGLSCLLVVNKVNRCIELFGAIKAYLDSNGYDNSIYCLSTNVVPADRLQRIQRIKYDMLSGKKPILIATQVVEAGVDLDFDMGFRDLGPIDSIVQVAGRINRQADPLNPQHEHRPLYVMNLGDCMKIYKEATTKQALKALTGKNAIVEADYLGLVDTYFGELADGDGVTFDESRHLFEAAKELRYDGKDKDDIYYVSNFEIIEESKNTVSVYILSDFRAYETLEAFKLMRSKDMTKEDFDRDFKRDFHQRIVAVPKWYTDHLENLTDYLKLAEPKDYDSATGFIRRTLKEVEKEENQTFML